LAERFFHSNLKSKNVHFAINGDAISGQGPVMDLQNEEWDMEDKDTRPKRRELCRWIERGFHIPSHPPNYLYQPLLYYLLSFLQ
jgi:hypothetical protein